jgi:hypothetical protein
MSDAWIETKTPKGEGVEKLAKAKGAFVKVGILSGTGEHPKAKHGQTIAEVGWWNEFGTHEEGLEAVPARPFLRTGLHDNIGKYRGLFKTLIKNTLLGRISTDQAVFVIGSTAVADVQAKIVSIQSPPNAPSTRKRKGSSNPLIDQGALRQHINWAKI